MVESDLSPGGDPLRSFSVAENGVGEGEIARAVAVIRAGGMVAFPTETYYGLAVDPFNQEALSRLFAVKRRAPDKPILCLVHERGQLGLLARRVPEAYEPLIASFWPGPLTLIFEAREEVPLALTGYSGTVGIRISSHPLATRLAEAFGGPISATSANLSGLPAAASAAEVTAQLGPDVDLVLDGGATPGGSGSTLVGFAGDEPILIRSGVISREELMDKSGREIRAMVLQGGEK
ncbi:MAG TPA: threonylcarbamoyl-AMP synthase [Desulfurivibrio alkaliphilus]|uniref:L-threonylcarbamoyladenylate synthase n=1 Tax=Desulfurivibrio alkaliphilus TaxID=427923 RepID=A0A7C2X8S9_9BACT|nr:threonylcarbamoyl-AMP synthase [Desulfurivibrio alkaliphilus]